jgi:hypothetical protein
MGPSKAKKIVAAKKVSGVGTKTRRSRRRKEAITDAECDPNTDQGLQENTEGQDDGDDENGGSFGGARHLAAQISCAECLIGMVDATIGQSARSVDDLEQQINSMKGKPCQQT